MVRNIYFALFWIGVGSLATVVVSAYILSRPQTKYLADNLSAPPNSGFEALASFDYSVPSGLVVGDVGDVLMQIENRHMAMEYKGTNKLAPASVPITVTLVTTPNCTATEQTSLPGHLPALAKIDETSAFEWTLAATAPGDCNLSFKTTMGNFMKPNSIDVPVRDRWGVAQWVPIIVAVIIALPGLIGHFKKTMAAA